MTYKLKELLLKIGSPELEEKRELSWHYFDKEKKDIEAFADLRLLDGGNALVAEQQRFRQDYEDDDGQIHETYVEAFYLHAKKIGENYKVTKLAMDGEEYTNPERQLTELALSMFHSRALDTSIAMLEQSLNKEELCSSFKAASVQDYKAHISEKFNASKLIEKKQTWGVVVPFPKVSRAA